MLTLTSREIECLQWAAQGKSSNEIAVLLGLTPRGIDFHFESARRKLEAKNRTHAVAIAVSNGLLDLVSDTRNSDPSTP